MFEEGETVFFFGGGREEEEEEEEQKIQIDDGERNETTGNPAAPPEWMV